MSKALIFSDIHIHPHKKSLDRLQDCLKALEWVFSTAKERKINDIIFAGDLFQDRQKIDVMTYHMTFDIFEKHCDGKLNVWLLLGNHDLWFHDKWDISSVKPFAALRGVTVIEQPCTLEIGGTPIDFLPYTHSPVEHLDSLRKNHKGRKGQKVLFGHLAVHGAVLNTLHNTQSDVIIEHDGEMIKVDDSVFEGWDRVFLGHYHGQQKIGKNAEYVGSTLQLTFGEAFQHKHIIDFDLEDGSREYIRNKFSPQHFIIPEKDIDKYDITKNFIRVSVDDISSSTVVELKKGLEGQKPATLEIMPAKQEDEAHIIDDAKAILDNEDQMLEKYIEAVFKQSNDTNLDKEKLLEVGKLICQTPVDS